MSDIRRRPARDDDEEPRLLRRRRRDEDDVDDEPRPRRPRREEDDEEEVRPRRSRRDDPDDDEDDRPRRRRRDEDEDEEDDRPRKKKKKTPPVGSMDLYLWIGLGVGGLVLVVGLVFALQWMFHDPFYKEIAAGTYNSPTGRPLAAGQPRPAVTKIVAVDLSGKKTDPAHYYIDSQYRASGPAEVSTVLQLSWRSEVVGTYSNGGGAATKWHVDAKLVDLKTGTLLASQHFVGSEPPRTVRVKRGFGSGGASGDKPLSQIAQWASQQATIR